MLRWLSSWPVGLAGFLGLNAWTVWGFFQSPLQVIAGLELRWSFFVLLACVAFPVTIVMAGGIVLERVAPMLPSRRFQDLAEEMRRMRDHLETVSISEGWLFDCLSTLIWKLDRLKLSTPPMDQRDDWIRWLVLMAPLAETRNIRKAREWKEGDLLPNVRVNRRGY